MKEEGYTSETCYEIWNDKTGTHIAIGPDRDGLDLIEIRQYSDDGKIGPRMVFTAAEIRLMIPIFKNWELV